MAIKKNRAAVALGRLGGRVKSAAKLEALKVASRRPRPGARKLNAEKRAARLAAGGAK